MKDIITKEQLAKDVMSLMKEFVNSNKEQEFEYDYVGVVEDNRDPDKIGRCRIRIHGLYDNIETKHLPWALPDFPLAVGVKGSFIVPEIGTMVSVSFDLGDRYEPRYKTKILDRRNLNFDCDKDEDYPDSVIFYETSNGDYFKINRAKGEFIIKTGAGVLLKMNQNGDVELTNTSSESGDVALTLKGDFVVDNRLGNTKISTNNYSTEAFGNVDIKSNGSMTHEVLDDYTIKTNRELDIVAGDRVYIKSRTETKIESQTNKIVANTIELNPSLDPTVVSKTYDTNGKASSTPTTFKVGIGNDSTKVLTMTVAPSIMGGPFNCIAFDPLTGLPHQGNEVVGVINKVGFTKDSVEALVEVSKQTTQVAAKYASRLKQETENILKRYSSIDSQAQLLMAGPAASSMLITKQAVEIAQLTAALASEEAEEITNLTNEILLFFGKPLYGTVLEPYTPEGQRNIYNQALSIANETAKLDLTGKTTGKDIVGAGKGIVDDIVEVL